MKDDALERDAWSQARSKIVGRDTHKRVLDELDVTAMLLFCLRTRRSNVQSTAAYSFKGLSQIIKPMAELGTLRVREENGEPTRCFDSERIWHQEENLKCAR